MIDCIRPLINKDFIKFQSLWNELISLETSEEDRILQPVKFSRREFILSRIFKNKSFWDNFLAYEIDGKFAGFVELCHHPGRESNIFIRNFILSQTFRSKGCGARFLEYIVHKYPCETDFFLEVRKENRAVNFYKRAGFFYILSVYYLVFENERKQFFNENKCEIRPWDPYKDWENFNYLLDRSSGDSDYPVMNFIPIFFKPGMGDIFFDNLYRNHIGHKLEIYVQGEDKETEVYGVIYSYLKYKIALVEFVFLPYIKEEVLKAFILEIINKVDNNMKIIITFNSSQRYIKDILLDLNGRIYRENYGMMLDRNVFNKKGEVI